MYVKYLRVRINERIFLKTNESIERTSRNELFLIRRTLSTEAHHRLKLTSSTYAYVNAHFFLKTNSLNLNHTHPQKIIQYLFHYKTNITPQGGTWLWIADFYCLSNIPWKSTTRACYQMFSLNDNLSHGYPPNAQKLKQMTYVTLMTSLHVLITRTGCVSHTSTPATLASNQVQDTGHSHSSETTLIR